MSEDKLYQLHGDIRETMTLVQAQKEAFEKHVKHSDDTNSLLSAQIDGIEKKVDKGFNEISNSISFYKGASKVITVIGGLLGAVGIDFIKSKF